MHLPELELAGRAKRVGIGRSELGDYGSSIRATLGSCVGIAILWPPKTRFVLVHALLPNRESGAGSRLDSRFADTAVPYAMKQLGASPEFRRQLVAFVAGGGQMYEGSDQKQQVGQTNADAALKALAAARIRVAGQDLGGAYPRQLVVDGPSLRVLSLSFADEVQLTSWEFPGARSQSA